MSQTVRKKSFEMDMTVGPLFKKLVIYALPLVGTNLLQMLFNAADVFILGVFCGDSEVASVGATTSLINLIIAVFVGLSAGASVIISRYMGAGDEEGAHRAVGTSMLVALISGVVLLIVGVTCSRYFLVWLDTPASQIEGATRYMTIYFLGVPIIMLYNFIASILRAIGDTVRPLIYLLIGGVLNIGLNIFCITVLNLTVEGVAIATVSSQLVSVVLSLIALFKSKGYGQFRFKYFRFYKKQLKEIVLVGLPSGLQGAMFNIANVFIQSNINSFGQAGIAANTYSQQFDAMLFHIGNGIALSTMAFVSQNYGAGKIDRIKKVFWESILLITGVGLVIGGAMVLCSDILLGFLTDDALVIEYAKTRLTILGLTYFVCGIMECFSYTLRALGKSIIAMIISLVGVCGVRILWLNTVFIYVPEFHMLYWAWTISWLVTIAMYACVLFPSFKKLTKKSTKENSTQNTEEALKKEQGKEDYGTEDSTQNT